MRAVVACTPLHGHVGPLLGVAAALARRGHEVVVCTGARFEDQVGDCGAAFVALPAAADYDDRRRPARSGQGRIARVNDDITCLLAAPLAAQHAAVDDLVARHRPDVVIADTSCLGAVTWRLTHPDGPPLAVVNVTFLTIPGRGVPPAGVGLRPWPGAPGAVRDAAVRAVTDRVLLRLGLRALRRAAGGVGVGADGLLFGAPGMADLLLVGTVPAFEHPRVDLPDHVRFVGPILPPASPVSVPAWWADLEGRTVVHVTQGTMDTADPGRLLLPTMAGLAGDDVVVVASTGGRPLPDGVPANARVAPYLPYDELLARTDVMVTNGGFGGVQRALAAGVPLVVAGDGEDKPEVAVRVARSGAGIDLRTGDPSPRRVAGAVRRVLGDPRYRLAAGALGSELRARGGAGAAADEVERLVLRTR